MAVEIYTKALCPYCSMAKRLLDKKGVAYSETDIMFKRSKKAEMLERSGGRHTVPQIFIGDMHVGGCDDLFALEEAGKLDPLLDAVRAA